MGAASVDFEIIEQNVLFACRLQISEGVWCPEPAEVKQVRIRLRTRDDEFGSSQGFRRAVYLIRERVEGQQGFRVKVPHERLR